MLLEFTTGNFKCFRDEITLSLVPAHQDKNRLGNIWQGHRHNALKSAALFGPNASGKTVLLDALFVFRRFVVESATSMTQGDPIPGISPFRLDSACLERPSIFEVLVEIDGVGYHYRIEVDETRVWRERLDYQAAEEKSRWITLINRDTSRPQDQQARLHSRVGSQQRRQRIVDDTRTNGLLLSRAAERNVELVMPLFDWFRNMYHSSAALGVPHDYRHAGQLAEEAAKDEALRQILSELVQDADTGILALRPDEDTASGLRVSVDIESPVNVDEIVGEFRRALHNLSENRGRYGLTLFVEHAMSSGERIRFTLDDESAGTLRYLVLAGRILSFCKTPGLMVVDELDASLHPQLARRVVQMLHSPQFNRAGAQMLFSTHDVTLMDPELLRRDQVFLAEKRPNGQSGLVSLWDFDEMPRNNAPWAKNYLLGRFGAVPVLGPRLADIPYEDSPTPPLPPETTAGALTGE